MANKIAPKSVSDKSKGGSTQDQASSVDPSSTKVSLATKLKSHLPKIYALAGAAAIFGGWLNWYMHRPMTAERYYWSGVKHLEQGVTSLAMKDWRASVKLDKTYSKSYVAMAQVEQESGNLGKAADLFGTVLYYHSKYPHIQCRRAQLYGMANRFEMAYTVAQDAVKIEPNCPTAHNALGMLLEKADDIAGAARELGKAHQLSPDDDALTLDYARVLALSGRHQEALDIVEQELPRAEKMGKMAVPAYYLHGWLLSEYGRGGVLDYTTAISNLGLALGLNPDHTASLTQLGIIYLQTGNDHGALIELEHAFKKGPDTIELIDALVEIYTRTQSPLLKQAQDIDDQIRKMLLPLKEARHDYIHRPDDPDTMMRLASLEKSVGNFLDAFELARAVHEKLPARKDAADLYNEMKNPKPDPAVQAAVNKKGPGRKKDIENAPGK